MAILNFIVSVVLTAIIICAFVGFVIFLKDNKKYTTYYQKFKDLKDFKVNAEKQMMWVLLFLSISVFVLLRVFGFFNT